MAELHQDLLRTGSHQLAGYEALRVAPDDNEHAGHPDKDQVCIKMRVDTEAVAGKQFLDRGEFLGSVRYRMRAFQDALLARARQRRDDAFVTIDDWETFQTTFAGDASTFAWCHWDGTAETEKAIKDATKVTIRCIPLPGQGPDPEPGTCVFSGKPSARRVLMAKAY